MIRVLANMAARGDVDAALATVRRILASHTAEVELPADPAGMSEAAAREGADLVVVVGGDGSVRSVAAGLAGTGVPLFVVPAGTGNSVYREVWEDAPWEETLAAVRDDRELWAIDLGRAGPARLPFLLGASAGMVRWAVDIAATMTDTSGRDLYATAGLEAAQRGEAFTAEVAVDGETLTSGPLMLAAVGGARHRAGSFCLLPQSRLDDGLLDVCTLTAVDFERLVALMAKSLDGTHLGEPEVSYAQGRVVELRSTDPLPLEVDGDPWGGDDTDMSFAVDPAALTVAMPG
ncbi:MAG: NAD(+)/NADH kinase [Acidimicrobiia bacterium]|nr:NAD(+)/NADH kinase [Acidimicrobiia bacterium]